MKKIILVSLIVFFNVCEFYCLDNKVNSEIANSKKLSVLVNRKVIKNENNWILDSRSSDSRKIESIGNKVECGEGIYFVYDSNSREKYLVDKNGIVLSEKQFMHVGHFSDGKTVVSGFMEDKYESDRIYDVLTDTVSEPISSMWIYCGFYDGLGAFSLRTNDGLLKSVLIDMNLKNVTGLIFDEFYERDFSDGTWHFVKDGKDYFISKNGKIINK